MPEKGTLQARYHPEILKVVPAEYQARVKCRNLFCRGYYMVEDIDVMVAQARPPGFTAILAGPGVLQIALASVTGALALAASCALALLF